MPWSTFEEGGRYCVHQLTPDGGKGEQVACHDSKEMADAQVRALYASEMDKATAKARMKLADAQREAEAWARKARQFHEGEESPIKPSMKIAKLDEDEQLVFGWAYVSASADGELIVDSDGESIEGAELEKAAYEFMGTYAHAGAMHEGVPVGNVVESLMLTAEKASAMGLTVPSMTGWWIGVKIKDADVFAKVKDGTFAMFSIQGFAEETADV